LYDGFLVLVGLFALIVTIACENDDLYAVNTNMMAICSLLTCIILIALGPLSFSHMVGGVGCKFEVLVFSLLAVSLLGSSLIRFVCMFWKYFTNGKMLPQELFDTLTYLVADFVPIFSI
jgi:hypothetical protein